MSVANAYAKALLLAAKDFNESQNFNEFDSQMASFSAALDGSKDATVALHGPLVSAREKVGIVREICKRGQFTPLMTEFLVLLARKGRLDVLKQIRSAFIAARTEQEGGITGQLIAADAMLDADIVNLAAAFTKKLGKKVSFRVSIDSALLAGVRVTVNGVTYDGSLRSQLQRLKNQISKGFSLRN